MLAWFVAVSPGMTGTFTRSAGRFSTAVEPANYRGQRPPHPAPSHTRSACLLCRFACLAARRARVNVAVVLCSPGQSHARTADSLLQSPPFNAARMRTILTVITRRLPRLRLAGLQRHFASSEHFDVEWKLISCHLFRYNICDRHHTLCYASTYGLHTGRLCIVFIMAALCNSTGHYIFALWFLLLIL